MKPDAIESLSFQIIDQEAAPHDFPPDEWAVVRRMIHTSADFDYQRTVRFHPKAIESGIQAIQRGNVIVTDTHMARAGIRQRDIARFGGQVLCFISDETVAQKAAAGGTTRALAAVDMALKRHPEAVFVVGNAPTALLRLMEHIHDGSARPPLVVGLPVGFVNAAESKEKLLALDVPFITNTGRKGGSNVAAAVVNALTLLAIEA